MKKNFYKKSISLLLASCMTLGTGVSAIATEIADDFRKESIEATEIEKPEEETPKTEETEGTVTGETEETEETDGIVTGETEKTEETEGTVINAELIEDIATTLEIKAAETLP